MASLTRWTWVWVSSGSWWRTGKPGVLQPMGSQRVGHDWVTELSWTDFICIHSICIYTHIEWGYFYVLCRLCINKYLGVCTYTHKFFFLRKSSKRCPHSWVGRGSLSSRSPGQLQPVSCCHCPSCVCISGALQWVWSLCSWYFIHSVVFAEHLLCARHYARHSGDKRPKFLIMGFVSN